MALLVGLLLFGNMASAQEGTNPELRFYDDLNRLRVEHLNEPAVKYNTVYTGNGNEYFVAPENLSGEMNSLLLTQTWKFQQKIYEQTRGRPFVLELMAGFSGPGYGNANFRADLKSFMTLKAAGNKQEFGGNVVTVFIGGGTKDGIGAMYEMSGQDILKYGAVSSEALKYELEYGNTLSRNQNAILLYSTFKDESGASTWEMKARPSAESYNVMIFNTLPARRLDFNLFEGGDIGLKEALEWVERATSADQSSRRFRLNLVIDYTAQKLKKDKGFRAATQMINLLGHFPELVPANMDVRVFEAGQISIEKNVPLSQFLKTKRGRNILERSGLDQVRYVERLKHKAEVAKAKYPTWFDQHKDAIEAQIRREESWTKLESLATNVLAAAKERNQLSRVRWQSIAEETPTGRLHPDDLSDRRDGTAARSRDLLDKRIQVLDGIISRMSRVRMPSVPNCHALFAL